MEPGYLTPQELVDRWRGLVRLSTLAQWRCKKRGPEFVKIGRNGVLYPLDAVQEFEQQHTFKTR